MTEGFGIKCNTFQHVSYGPSTLVKGRLTNRKRSVWNYFQGFLWYWPIIYWLNPIDSVIEFQCEEWSGSSEILARSWMLLRHTKMAITGRTRKSGMNTDLYYIGINICTSAKWENTVFWSSRGTLLEILNTVFYLTMDLMDMLITVGFFLTPDFSKELPPRNINTIINRSYVFKFSFNPMLYFILVEHLYSSVFNFLLF